MKCHTCNNVITKRIDPNKLKRNKHFFCSRPCYVTFWASEKKGSNNVNWNPKNERTCKVCSKVFRRAVSNKIVPIYCSMKCSGTGRRGKTAGDKNGMWKGGISGEENSIRHSIEYIEWRNAVGRRDKSKCRFCKSRKSIVAHHVKSFRDYKKLRFEVDNGITLCRSCHTELHAKNKGVQDFTNILNDYMPNKS